MIVFYWEESDNIKFFILSRNNMPDLQIASKNQKSTYYLDILLTLGSLLDDSKVFNFGIDSCIDFHDILLCQKTL